MNVRRKNARFRNPLILENLSKVFNPNWYEGEQFYLLVLFGSDFVSLNFYQKYLEVKIDTILDKLASCQAH